MAADSLRYGEDASQLGSHRESSPTEPQPYRSARESRGTAFGAGLGQTPRGPHPQGRSPADLARTEAATTRRAQNSGTHSMKGHGAGTPRHRNSTNFHESPTPGIQNSQEIPTAKSSSSAQLPGVRPLEPGAPSWGSLGSAPLAPYSRADARVLDLSLPEIY
jgi:hypothetical protein